jgi:hypothetical protein
MEPQRTEIDGVPTFWVESGRPTLSATLVFRVGAVDEALPQHGWTHLLEHLALHGEESGLLDVNGSVELTLTTFSSHGPVDDVVDHLGRLTRWLREPQLDGVDHERRVLAAESRLRGGAVSSALAQRYGARGPGVVNYGEMGLSRATPEALRGHAARAFGRRNGALVLDGPPPPNLELQLAEGARIELPDARAVDDVLPATYVEESGLVVSGVVERTVAATILTDLLQQSLHDRLRKQRAAAYAPWADYRRVSPDHAVVMAGSDVTPDLLPDLAETALQWVRGQRHSSADVSTQVERRIRSLTDPYAAAGLAYAAAVSWLLDGEAATVAERLHDLRSVGAVDVAESLEQWRRTALLGFPGATHWNEQIRRSRPRRVSVQPGSVHRHRNWPAESARLVLSNGGALQLQSARGELAHVFDPADLVISGRREGGGRYLVDADGWPFWFDPREWTKGSALERHLDATVAQEKVVDLPAAPATRWQRARWWSRWTLPVRRRIHLTWPMVGRLLVAAVFATPLALVLITAGRGSDLPDGALIGSFWLAVAGTWVLGSSAFEPDG